MADIRPVVIGITDKFDAPLRFALDEAQRRGAPLRVVHCAAMPLEQVKVYLSNTAYRELLSAGQAVLDTVQQVIEHEAISVDAEYVLSSRTPMDLLTEEAQSAQLLVIGIDDIRWYDRLLGGAVAGHLTQHAHCAVVAVPASGRDGHAGVVAALDGNTAARPLLQLAFEIAQDRGGTVHALGAVPAGAEPAAIEAAKVGLGEVLAGWAELYPDVRVEQEIVVGEPDDACIAATRSAELVLVGRTRRHGLRRPIAVGVVRHASCAVGVVPLEDHDA